MDYCKIMAGLLCVIVWKNVWQLSYSVYIAFVISLTWFDKMLEFIICWFCVFRISALPKKTCEGFSAATLNDI